MMIEHAERRPEIDPSAWIAPSATVCGDVRITAGARILHGACLIGEAGGSITIGKNCIVMENAVIRAGAKHPCQIGDHCLVGPHAHVTGAVLEEEVFIATSAQVFHGARLGKGCEVQVRGTVHLRTFLEPGRVVPIGWVAIGNPAKVLSPDQHEQIWELQKPLNFPQWVYGLERETPNLMRRVTERLSEQLGAHRSDVVLAASESTPKAD